ncbi:MAG TPA: right-handed parallel beta-helix repeat-containing protein [Candidatus Cloacimonadota bacterium]|nr:right-handed parallel beta-helix repeat-containing protein [Candidatus Cloacimonadota bacterium]
MKKLLFALGLLMLTLQVWSATYYVSTSGSNSNNGTTTGTPWQTLSKVNSYSVSPGFVAGDIIRFRCGEVFRGYLTISNSGSSGSPITLTSYGAGEKPVIAGAADVSSSASWSNTSGSIWRTTVSPPSPLTDAGNIIFNNDANCGRKRTTLATCTVQGDWFYDTTDDRVYMYSASNPGTYYTHIELGGIYSENVLTIGYRSYITVDGLSVKYSANNGIMIREASNVIVQNCEVAWIGGMYYGEDGNGYRMGNGIQIWNNNNNITVRYNYVHDIYDAGISPQGSGAYTQSNISIYYNVFEGCYYTYEVFTSGDRTLTNVNFYNNTCLWAGTVWSVNQRPDASNARHVRTWGEDGTLTNNNIKNNIFYEATQTAYAHYYSCPFTLDHNLYYVDYLGYINTTTYTSLASWRAATGDDYNSLSADPLLNVDYTLRAGSPAINAGEDLSLTRDYNGDPIVGNPDIGAFEYQVATTNYANLVIEGHSFVADDTWLDYYLPLETDVSSFYNSAQSNSHIADNAYPYIEGRASTVDGHLVTETATLKNIMVLWIGCNDMTNTVGDATATYNLLKSYVQDRLDMGWKVFAYTITPTNAYGRGAGFEAKRIIFNNLMMTDLALMTNVYVLNTDDVAAFDDPSNTTYFTDGLHLTQLGSQLASSLFGDAIADYWTGEPVIPPVTPSGSNVPLKTGNKLLKTGSVILKLP